MEPKADEKVCRKHGQKQIGAPNCVIMAEWSAVLTF